MKLYLSGQMSGLEDHGVEAFRRNREALRAEGYDVACPAELGQVDGWSWEDYLKRDLQVMLDCEGVATIDGYEVSRGARLETFVAREVAMPVKSVTDWLFWADRLRKTRSSMSVSVPARPGAPAAP